METGDDVQAARLAPEVRRQPGLLPSIAELIVFPVTALAVDTDLCADSFVLDEVGVIYLQAIHTWAKEDPAAPGIADTIAHFVCQVFTDDPADDIRRLEAMRDEWVARARAAVNSEVALRR